MIKLSNIVGRYDEIIGVSSEYGYTGISHLINSRSNLAHSLMNIEIYSNDRSFDRNINDDLKLFYRYYSQNSFDNKLSWYGFLIRSLSPVVLKSIESGYDLDRILGNTSINSIRCNFKNFLKIYESDKYDFIKSSLSDIFKGSFKITDDTFNKLNIIVDNNYNLRDAIRINEVILAGFYCISEPNAIVLNYIKNSAIKGECTRDFLYNLFYRLYRLDELVPEEFL